MRRRRAEPPPPPWALLSFLLRYPDAERGRARDDLAARWPRCPAGPRATRSSASSPAGPATRRRSPRATSRRSTCAAARACTSPTTRTATRASAAWRCCASRSSTAPPGCRWTSAELPDHLTVMLAFAALAPAGHGEALLAEHRPAIELLRLSLHDLESPYAHVLDAIAAGLPALTRRPSAREVARLAREGPPEEAVGLEPYGPPEAMPTGAHA